MCEFAATNQSHLKKHRESKHEGIRIIDPYDMCEYPAITSWVLKVHKESKNERD